LGGSFNGNSGTNNFNYLKVAEGATAGPSGDVTVTDTFLVAQNATYGGGDTDDTQLTIGGTEFNVSLSGGTFEASQIKFNTGNYDADQNVLTGDPVKASGEVLSKVQITNGTSVDLDASFIVNDLLTIGDIDRLTISNNGSLTLNDDFQNNGVFSPGSRTVSFEGGTNTGSGSNYDPEAIDCDSNGGTETAVGPGGGNDGDCEQDVFGSGNFSFGDVKVDGDDTRVKLSGSDQSGSVPAVEKLTIDAQGGLDSPNTNIELVLGSDLDIFGSLVNNGTFLPEQNRVTFKGGTSTIDTGEPLTFFDFTVDTGAGSRIELINNAEITVNNELETISGGLFLDESDKAIINGVLRMSGGLDNNGARSPDFDGNGLSVVLNSSTAELRFQSGEPVSTLPGGVASGRILYNDGNGDGTLDGVIGGSNPSVQIEREIDGGPGWYYLRGPDVSSNYTFDDLLQNGPDDLWTQGFTGADASQSRPEVSNVIRYNESAAAAAGDDTEGWESIGAITDQPTAGRGYAVYVYRDQDFDGESEGFPKELTLNRALVSQRSFEFDSSPPGPGLSVSDGPDGGTTAGDGAAEGWNLLSNPYLTTVDWDAFSSNSDVMGTVYVWDAKDGSYNTWNGSSGNLTDGAIAPFQSFFVKAMGSSPSLSIGDITNVQTNTSNAFIAKEQRSSREIELKVSLDGQSDNTYSSFLPSGKVGLDRRDAYYLDREVRETTPVVELYSVLEGEEKMQISNLPVNLSDTVAVPIHVKASGCKSDRPLGEGRQATLTWPSLQNIPSDWTVLLETPDGSTLDLREKRQHAFDLTSSTDCSGSKQRRDRRPPALTSPDPRVASSSSKSGEGTQFTLRIRPGPEPVKVGSFSATSEGKDALLEWAITGDVGVERFEIQHKFGESESFSTLATVDGSEENSNYQFRTGNLEVGSHTFRVRQIPKEGSASLTDPVSVNIGMDEALALSAYPNPVRQQATVEFAVREKGTVTLALYNTLGQRVKTVYKETPPAEQLQRLQLTTDNLSSGLYFLRLSGPNASATRRITVVR
jgi:hypothetical protein